MGELKTKTQLYAFGDGELQTTLQLCTLRGGELKTIIQLWALRGCEIRNITELAHELVVRCVATFQFVVLELQFLARLFVQSHIAFVLLFIVHLRQFFRFFPNVEQQQTRKTVTFPFLLTCAINSCFTAVIFILRPLVDDEL